MGLGSIVVAPVLAAALAGALLFLAAMVWRPMPPRLSGRGGAAPAGGRRQSRPAGSPAGQLPVLPPAVAARLVVALLDAGLPVEVALESLRRHLAEAGLAEPAGLAAVLEALDLATQSGLAPGALVRAAAGEQRRREVAERTVAAQRLAVLVVLPMGLCLLPAFVLLTVVPLVLGLLAG